jgi:Ser/Thr protein kinase RdoA (MazF antagonist)
VTTAQHPPPFTEADVRSHLGRWGLESAKVSPLPRGASGEVFLVEAGGERFVAKHAYMHRHEFEPGLMAADVVSRAGEFRAAGPVRTAGGDVLVMVEHDGLTHPLALLRWVNGRQYPVEDETSARELGVVLGRVQRTLAAAPAAELQIEPVGRAYLDYLRSTSQDLGDYGWLHHRIGEIVARIDTLLDAEVLTHAAAVWDGPERLRDRDGSIGLIDFGNTGWYPVAHTIGYGTSQVRISDAAAEARAVDAFVTAFASEFPVSAADLDSVPLFRLATVATYAKFMARRAATGQLPEVMRVGFSRVLAELT